MSYMFQEENLLHAPKAQVHEQVRQHEISWRSTTMLQQLKHKLHFTGWRNASTNSVGGFPASPWSSTTTPCPTWRRTRASQPPSVDRGYISEFFIQSPSKKNPIPPKWLELYLVLVPGLFHFLSNSFSTWTSLCCLPHTNLTQHTQTHTHPDKHKSFRQICNNWLVSLQFHHPQQRHFFQQRHQKSHRPPHPPAGQIWGG